jgi:RNase H-fold protein (predicted Holliday junction resolvase)
MIIGFDPGRDKCGIAVRDDQGQFPYHQVVNSEDVLTTLQSLCKQFTITLLVMGNQTTSKQWKKKLESELSFAVFIEMVDERNSSLEARDRYWEMYPLKGITRVIPLRMRFPSRPIDDIVAIVLIERYLNKYNQ